MSSPHFHEHLTHENAILLLVDHQVALYTGVCDIDTFAPKHNVVGQAKTEAVYAALGSPFAGFVYGLKQIFSHR
ncbi:hypothetical protein [Pseudomonas chlororaphis]|uniref:hypothetical protein n=1 Tax=Pseudomonas chlororaphis TaxID=587753 RepID=UPI000F5862D5|nr:hypothetical protein [Pseudomonas chlororaphis]AZD74442.1 hypothetical protein C4K16_4090 [Pseudomonas chlororaphis subsp. aurantiaca]